MHSSGFSTSPSSLSDGFGGLSFAHIHNPPGNIDQESTFSDQKGHPSGLDFTVKSVSRCTSQVNTIVEVTGKVRCAKKLIQRGKENASKTERHFLKVRTKLVPRVAY